MLRQCLADEVDYPFSNTPTYLNNRANLKRNAVYVDQGKEHGVVRAELRLLELYARTRQSDPARVRCLQIVERYRMAEDLTGRAWFSDTYAIPLLRRLNILDEALDLQTQIVARAEAHPEESAMPLPDRLTTLAEIYEAMSRYEEALEIFGRVLKIREQEFNQDGAVQVDALAAGTDTSHNPSQQNLDTALLNYNRCLTHLGRSPQDAS
jgi:tetratricopeptide (TPR) repeat protein